MATRILGTLRSFQTVKESRKNDHVIFAKTSRTIFCFVLLVSLPYVLPGLHRFRLLPVLNHSTSQTASLEASTQIENVSEIVTTSGTLKLETKPGEIEDPSGKALGNFFAALLKTETTGGQTRISHYGDSPITNDGITATVR